MAVNGKLLKGLLIGVCFVTAICCWYWCIHIPITVTNSDKRSVTQHDSDKRSVTQHDSDKRSVTQHDSKPAKYYKTFVYLTMTESCLSETLRSPQQIGDPTSCQCDVLVLSWKKECNDSSLPHVEYIFNPKTSWTTGRNVLYRAIMKREKKYLYYTFFDDDIKLVFYKEKPRGNVSPWREYEWSLLKLGPAVGVAWDTDKRHFEKYYDGKCNYPSKTDFLPLTWYNALFNSFHSEVIEYLLPYYDKMEETSIWYSQLYLIMKCDLMFQPGQVLHHVNIFAENPLHRPYARKMHDSSTVRWFLNDFKSEIPTKYHKQLEPRIQDWVKNVNKKEEAKYHCPHFPEVRRPFVPYLHLDNQTLYLDDQSQEETESITETMN